MIAAAGRPRLGVRACYARETLTRVGFSPLAFQLVVGSNATDVYGFQAKTLLHPRHSGHRPGKLFTPKALLGPRSAQIATFLELSFHSSLDNRRSFVQDQLLQVDHQEEDNKGRTKIDISCHLSSLISTQLLYSREFFASIGHRNLIFFFHQEIVDWTSPLFRAETSSRKTCERSLSTKVDFARMRLGQALSLH